MDENSESKISNPAQPLIRSWRSIYPREDFTNAFVIGLAGLALSGKTTVAEAVLAELSRQAPAVKAIKLSFASRMKEVLVALVGKEHSFQPRKKKKLSFMVTATGVSGIFSIVSAPILSGDSWEIISGSTSWPSSCRN